MLKGVGVYIGSNEVIAVSAVRSAAGPQIKKFAIEPIEAENHPEAWVGKEAHRIKNLSPSARAILKALEKIQEPGAFVNVAVSPIQVVTRNFIMPTVPKKDEAGAVQNEASRYIPFKVTESVLDYQSHSTHKNVSSITATAIRTEILETCLNDLRSVSAKTLMVEPVYIAVARAYGTLNMLEKSKTHGFVVLQSDGNVNVTLASKGVVYLSRDFLLSGKLEMDKGRFYEELKASIDYFYKLTGGESIGQIFLSGAGDLKVWVEHLEHASNYTIRFDVANSPNIKNVPSETLSTLLTAFGLALRSLGHSSLLGDVKLLPKEDRRSSLQQLFIFLGIECLVILILFLGLRLAAFQPYVTHLIDQNETVLDIGRQEDPAFGAKSIKNLEQEKVMLEGRVNQLEPFFSDSIPTSVFLRSFGQGLPKSISLDYVSFENAPGKEASMTLMGKKRLNVKGTCYLGNAEKETSTVSSWIQSLTTKNVVGRYFGEIKLEEIKRVKVEGRDFTEFRALGEGEKEVKRTS